MDLSTRQLRAFLALRDLQNFTKAAAAVHLSQPAFSSMVRGIEEVVGHQLVLRNSRGVRLTPVGEQFAIVATRMLEEFDVGMRSLRTGFDPGNQVSIGAMVALTYEWLPPVLAHFKLREPDVQVEMLAVFPKDCLTLIEAKRVDFAITAIDTPPPGIATEVLWRDPFHLVCRADHALADCDSVSLEDLCMHKFVHYAGNTLARAQIDRAVLPKHLQIACETEHIYTIKALVESGIGISLVTELNRKIFDSASLVTRPISGEGLARDIAIAWRSDRPLQRAAANLLEALRAAVPQIAPNQQFK